MTYNFATRMDRLGSRMKQLHDNVLTYTRGGVSVRVTNFTPERFDVNSMAAYGVVVITEKFQDFIFDASKLGSFSPTEPQIGDTITWGTRTFTVVALGPPGEDAECYRYTTSSRARVRVHTRQTS